MSKHINGKIFVYQWNELEEKNGNTSEFFIECYGITQKLEGVYLKISGFKPYFYVELPKEIEKNDILINTLKTLLNRIDKKNKPLEIESVFKRKLYYTHKYLKKDENGEYIKDDKKYQFLKLTFNTKSSMEYFSNNFRKPFEINNYEPVQLNLCEYERNVSQVIKFLSSTGLPPAGWIQFSGVKMNNLNDEVSFKHKISADILTLKNSDVTNIVLPNVLCFDIEANSTIKNGFPNASIPEDRVFQISCCLLTSTGKIQKYLLTLGEVNRKIIGEDVIIREFGNSEAKLLTGFTDLVRETNVNVIIGYNILSWDMKYMLDRCKLYKNEDEFCKMGIFVNEKCEIVSNSFKSKAYSAQNLTYVNTKGRLFLDLLPIIRRDYKLSNYKLKTVTTHFGLPTKDPLTAQDIFNNYNEYFKNYTSYKLKDMDSNIMENYKKGVNALSIVGKYCVQDSYITLLLYQKLQLWFGLCEMSKTAKVPIFYLFTEGTQIQMYSQVLEYCNKNNIVVNKGIKSNKEDNYQGATVLNPVPGKYDKVLSFDFASLYPSIMMAYNIDYSTYVIDENVADEDCHIFEWKEHVNCEHDMNRKKKKDGSFSTAKRKVFCADRKYIFLKEEVGGKGVVPTLLTELIGARKNTRKQIAINEDLIETLVKQLLFLKYKYTDKIDSKNIDTVNEFLKSIKSIPEVFVEFEKIETENKDNPVSNEMINFIGRDFYNNLDSNDSYNSNKLIIELYEKCRDTIQYNQVLDKRQLSYKVCANSMYGAMGVKKGYLPLPQGAMSITYKGRSSIEFISTYIPDKYNGKTVYGDTDSSMIYFEHIKNNKDAVELAEEITKDMEKHFKKPMKLEFEKIYEKYLILSKKRYLAQVANKEGKIVDFVKKGVVLTRRDNCKALRDIYLKTAVNILENVNKITILENIVDYINDMFKRKMDYTMFVITKSLSKDINEYDTKKALPSHVQLAKRIRERGLNIETGSRIEFLFTTNGRYDPKFNQGDKVESLEHFEKWLFYLRIDYLYYLEKQIVTPLDEIISVGLNTENFTERLYLYHNQYFLMRQEFENLKTKVLFENVSEEDKTVEKQTVEKPIRKDISPRYKSQMASNSKKLWSLEIDYIDKNINKYTDKEIEKLKKIRGIKTTKTNKQKTEENRENEEFRTLKEKSLDLVESQIYSTYFLPSF
jgi:DNA polymerase elongation subunit (family B)